MWANKISASGVILKWVKSNRRSEKKKVSENNGQLRFRPSPSWTNYLFRTGHFSVPGEVGQKQKMEKRKRLNDGNNNGQATYGARKHAWHTQAAWNNISFNFTN